jgi:hypothetical protein
MATAEKVLHGPQPLKRDKSSGKMLWGKTKWQKQHAAGETLLRKKRERLAHSRGSRDLKALDVTLPGGKTDRMKPMKETGFAAAAAKRATKKTLGNKKLTAKDIVSRYAMGEKGKGKGKGRRRVVKKGKPPQIGVLSPWRAAADSVYKNIKGTVSSAQKAIAGPSKVKRSAEDYNMKWTDFLAKRRAERRLKTGPADAAAKKLQKQKKLQEGKSNALRSLQLQNMQRRKALRTQQASTQRSLALQRKQLRGKI